jgi:hypothetical protein
MTLTRVFAASRSLAGLVFRPRRPRIRPAPLANIARSTGFTSPVRRMAKPLRSQLNQIRAWVRQGRTDAWIAHQLEVSTNELREFRRRHELDSEEEDNGEVDLRDEIEAEIEAATREEEAAAAEAAEDEEEAGEEDEEEGTTDEGAGDADEDRPKRRRRRRGGRGRGRGRAREGEADGDGGTGVPAKTLQGTFDHGDADGYGLWLDPAIADDPVYSENWAGKRRVDVTIEADRIVIKRSK